MPHLAQTIFLIVGFCMSSFAAAQYRDVSPEEAEHEMCKKVGCAFDVRIVLKQKDGAAYDESFHVLPVVQPGGVSVYAGQSVLFEADVQGDRLGNFKLVKSVEHPERTLSASLEQSGDYSMKLVVRNPFKQPLKIAMGIMPLDHNDLVTTSSCPVVAGGASYELWPYPLFQVWLGNIRLLKDLSEVTCSE